jgi:DNA invertase Pin-like site-specific DNA recombinase
MISGAETFAFRRVFAEYVDTGFSGAASSRPQLDRLLHDARLHRFDGVLVWKLDPWGRSVAHFGRSIQELVSLGIRFLSPTESIDTGAESPMSKFLLHLFAAFAEMEREIIRERVRAGVRDAKAKGTRLGAPTACLPARRGTAEPGDELAKTRANAKSTHVHRNRLLPTPFGKPSGSVAPPLAQTQALSQQCFSVRETCDFRTAKTALQIALAIRLGSNESFFKGCQNQAAQRTATKLLPSTAGPAARTRTGRCRSQDCGHQERPDRGPGGGCLRRCCMSPRRIAFRQP